MVLIVLSTYLVCLILSIGKQACYIAKQLFQRKQERNLNKVLIQTKLNNYELMNQLTA